MPRIAKLKDIPKRLLKVTKENNIKPQEWDVFTFSIHKWKYMYGKVISKDINCGFWYPDPLKLILIYLYGYISENKKDVPKLDKERLLWRPIFVNKEIWMWWYFEILENSPIKETEVYSPLCFEYSSSVRPYFDEKFNQLDKKYPWCWSWWSTNIFWVEHEILKYFNEDFVKYEKKC